MKLEFTRFGGGDIALEDLNVRTSIVGDGKLILNAKNGAVLEAELPKGVPSSFVPTAPVEAKPKKAKAKKAKGKK